MLSLKFIAMSVHGIKTKVCLCKKIYAAYLLYNILYFFLTCFLSKRRVWLSCIELH